MKWYVHVIKNGFNFSGRARRKEYWMFILFNFLFSAVALSLDTALGFNYESQLEDGTKLPYGYIYSLYTFCMIIPSLAVTVRRLHDVNKSGWYILMSLIPLVGGILVFIKLVTEGDRGENPHGPNPKAMENPYSSY